MIPGKETRNAGSGAPHSTARQKRPQQMGVEMQVPQRPHLREQMRQRNGLEGRGFSLRCEGFASPLDTPEPGDRCWSVDTSRTSGLWG